MLDHRYPGRFDQWEYVTMREVQRDGQTVMVETPVARMLIKSAPGRVVQNGDRYQIEGMAWGPNPISTVEVKIDNGPWQKAKLDRSKRRLHGKPGRWTGSRPWVSTRSPRGRSMQRAPCSQRRMIRE